MDGDVPALEEDLDGAAGQADIDPLTGEAMRHAVKMAFDIDVIIEADGPDPPFRQGIGLNGHGVQGRTVDLVEQLAPDDTQTP